MNDIVTEDAHHGATAQRQRPVDMADRPKKTPDIRRKTRFTLVTRNFHLST
jgi:hypothetical protein